jgi:hypothetical protein
VLSPNDFVTCLEAHNKLEEDMVYRLPAKFLEPEEQAALENLPSDNVAQDHSRHCDGAAESALVIAASSLNIAAVNSSTRHRLRMNVIGR